MPIVWKKGTWELGNKRELGNEMPAIGGNLGMGPWKVEGEKLSTTTIGDRATFLN
jgi:hypothetical protein